MHAFVLLIIIIIIYIISYNNRRTLLCTNALLSELFEVDIKDQSAN